MERNEDDTAERLKTELRGAKMAGGETPRLRRRDWNVLPELLAARQLKTQARSRQDGEKDGVQEAKQERLVLR